MINILLIAPYPEFAAQFIQLFKEHEQVVGRYEYDKETYKLDVVVAGGIEELATLNFNAEVIISRGFLARDLRRKEYFIPVVEVPVAASDLVHCLHRAQTQYGCTKIAVVGSSNMVMGVEKLSEIFSMEIEQHVMATREEIDECLSAIRQSGISVVVGGVKTCERAAKLGFETILLESGKEAIWHSITEAKRLAYISREEEKKSQNLKAIFDNALEGIITLDADGIIEVLNSAAARILSVEPLLVIGKPIRQVLPYPQLECLLDDACGEGSEIIKHESGSFTVTCAPIIVRNDRLGRFLILQEVERIQELEKKIREKIYQRGHVVKHTFEDVIGESRKIKELIQRAKKYSQVDSNIIIVGETGTGKELFAQSIHGYSRRRQGPFVAVNCAALSESLLESELFGYVEGAFTGASKGGKPGLFELAHRGTLFLDEISEIPSQLQGRLLRAIQEKEIRRLGDDRVIPVDVRIISATNRKLRGLVDEGRFREDLYYRLDILELELPPLGERREDIPALVAYWVRKYGLEFKMEEMRISSRAAQILSRCDWPGNIRHLRNICERLVVLSQCEVIDAKDVEAVLADAAASDARNADLGGADAPILPRVDFREAVLASGLQGEMKELERGRIVQALRSTSFNKIRAAEILGMSRTTLWRKMRELNVS
ncbi:MAG TPA: sigma 54-interacting transcriptional regulator [Spirochaetia bacterium]|nr:sigma 54-interacting transcriptional regulator [Spirochaetia bacterium]